MKTISISLSFLLILLTNLFASSGESEAVYVGHGNYKSTRPLWANAYAPNTPANNEDGVNDLNPGDIFKIGKLSKATTILINGFPSNIEAYLANIEKGDRVLIRNERRWIQLLNLHTSNFFDEGVIEKVSDDGKTVTVKYYTNLPSGRVRFESREFKLTDKMTVRYEGKKSTLQEAMKTGRHLRLYKARGQVVLASNEVGRQDTREIWGQSKGWLRQAFFRGTTQHQTFFAEYLNGKWTDSFADGRISDIDGYNLGPGAEAAYARPGDKLITGSRLVGGTSAFNTTYGTFIPGDDGSVTGEITKIDGNKVSLKVAVCPTGKAKDGRFETVTVTINDNAEYHLNGKRNSTKETSLKVGNHIRVLEAIPHGAAISRDTDDSKMAAAKMAVHPIFPTGRSVPMHFLNHSWQQAEEIKVLENQFAKLDVFLYTTGATQYEWRRNGVLIPGSQGTVDGYKVLKFDEYADLNDNGASFTCVAKNAAGEVESMPIKLSVSADTRPLNLAGAYVAGKNTMIVNFTKKVDPKTAQNPANYSTSVKVLKATLTGDEQTVVLKTEDLTAGANYELSAKNIFDISATPNRIVSDDKLNLSYRVAFRYFKFTMTKKKALNGRLNSLRLKVGDKTYGKDVKAWGTSKNKENLFDEDNKSYGQFDVNQFLIMDLGAGIAIAPDAITFQLTTSARPFMGYRLEGSNDIENWTVLKEHSVTLKGDTSHEIDTKSLDAKEILKAKSVQSINFPKPETTSSTIEIKANTNSGLPVSYAIIEGPAEVDGKQLKVKAAGKVRLRAVQAGNKEYYSALPVEIELTVSKP